MKYPNQMKSASIEISDRPEDELVPDLKDRDQWLCWRYNSGRKPPVDPLSGRFVDATDRSNWDSFDSASEYADRVGAVDGVGYCLSSGDGVVVIDLDDCLRDSMLIDGWALDIIEDIDSYTERSPGGSGLHVLANADIGTYGKAADEELEIYDARKYFTYTGEHIDGFPVELKDRTSQVTRLIREYRPFVS